jgi:O-antigen ligase
MISENLITSDKIIKFVVFTTICIVYAFSNIRMMSLLIQFIFLFLMTLYILKEGKLKITIHFYWMMTFILWALFTALFSYNATASMNDVINISLKFLSYTVLIMFIDNKKKYYFVLKAIAIAGLILCLRVFFLTPTDIWGSSRIGKDFGLNPNTIGMVLSYSAIAFTYLGIKCNKKLYFLFIVPLAFIGLLTGSRKAFLMIIGGIFLLLFLNIKKLKSKLLFIVTAILSVLVIYQIIMNIPYLYEILGKRIDITNIINQQFTASTNTRLLMIKEGWQLFAQRPIIGYGLENYRIISSFRTYSHNNYIELFVSTGLVGVLIYYSLPIWILVSSLIKKVKGNIEYNIIIVFFTIILIIDFALVSYDHLITHFIIAANVAYYKILLLKQNNYKDSIQKERSL